MVRNLDPQDPARFRQAPVQAQVPAAGPRRPGRMIVGQDDGGGAVRDGIGENLAGMRHRRIQNPHGHDPASEYFAGAA